MKSPCLAYLERNFDDSPEKIQSTRLCVNDTASYNVPHIQQLW